MTDHRQIQLTQSKRLTSSFRDCDAFVFSADGVIYRQVNQSYSQHYDKLMSSGLYAKLVKAGLLVAHEEVTDSLSRPSTDEQNKPYKVIKPEMVPFISYPYEWCFEQLKQAALLTLTIQMTAMEHSMTLKDATSFNVQFVGYRPVFIDTTSFEVLPDGEPWFGYKQFCEHFLTPLLVCSYSDIRAIGMLRAFIDGIPLEIASALLPWHSWVNPSIFSHVHLHAKMISKVSQPKPEEVTKQKMSSNGQLAIIDNLKSLVSSLKLPQKQTTWSDYYDNTNYSDGGLTFKETVVDRFIEQAAPSAVWDLGANDGRFSKLAVKRGIRTISMDFDPSCVERSYAESCKLKATNWLPLYMDLCNQSPSLGWNHEERQSLVERGPAELAMALAVMHHLVITNNVPLDHLALFFARVSKQLIIEFVPISDSQSQRLVHNVRRTHHNYDRESFEHHFGMHFDILEAVAVPDSDRILYLLKRR